MKISILYIGYYYNKVDTYNIDGKIRNVNWRDTYGNQQNNIYDDLISTYNAEIDVYISTYNSKYNNKLLQDFKPKKCIFNELNTNLTNAEGRYNNIIKGLNLINKENIEYDQIILLRLDLFLINKITSLNIDLNRFNITFLNYDGLCYDDIFTFCIFNYKYFEVLKNFLFSDYYKYKALHGGYNVHILCYDLFNKTQIQPNLMIKDGNYKLVKGWQVNINPIYFLTSQMNEYCCYLCYQKYDNNKYDFPCGCIYHKNCYFKFHKNNEKCVKCRNNNLLNMYLLNNSD